jgi:hypothetical protein
MSDAELAEAIEKSKISPKADTRSEEERNAYAAWQAKQRQIYHERLYFEQAKQRLGKAMPYENVAAFRRSYRTKEGTFAHERSHNLIKDFKEYNELKAVLQGDNLPKTLAEYQEIKYNENKQSDFKKISENYLQEKDYLTAATGGAHSGKYQNFVQKYTTNQLEKSIKSYNQTIEEHYEKLQNPIKYIEDWDERDERYKTGIMKKWQKDIKRNIEERNIAIGILKRRK